MIDIKLLRENPEKVKKACESKQARVDIDQVLELDKKKPRINSGNRKIESRTEKIGQRPNWASKRSEK